MDDRKPGSSRRSIMKGAAAMAAVGYPALAQTRPERRVLWAANVRTKPLTERLAAAQAGGFTHMSVFPIDYRAWTESGMPPDEIRARIRDAGLHVLAIDPFVQWVPGFTLPKGYPPEYLGFIDSPEAAIMRIAEDLEAEAINCVEGLGQPHDTAALVDAFGAFADRAAAAGLRLTLEFMPISSIPDLAAGWEIVAGAGRPNAGLCFDTWHYFRSGPDPDLLARLPGDRVFEVQLADAPLALEGRDLTEDLLRFRRLPGEGAFDITGVTDRLKAIGAWTSVGPEVFSDAFDALDAVEVGRRCGASLARWS